MNKVYALMGPPACGKTSIAKELRQYGIPEIISHTTRAARNAEKQGEDYYFITNDEFNNIQLIERASYSGNFYGLSREEVLSKVNKYPVSVVTIDANGLDQMKMLLGERVESIFILVDATTIIQRSIIQGGDPEIIKQRIEYAVKAGEFDNWKLADYVVKNTGSFEVTIRQMLAIMGVFTPIMENTSR